MYVFKVKHKKRIKEFQILKDILRNIYFIIFFPWVSSGYQVRISSKGTLK